MIDPRPLDLPAGEILSARTRDGGSSYFEIRRKLGTGGAGIVYEAVADDGRVVVVKGPRLIGARAPQIQREVDVLTALPDHPNLPRFEGSVADPRGHVLVLLERAFENPFRMLARPAVRGRLTRKLDPKARDVPLPVPTALELAYELAIALEHLHSHHYVHCDVKPANLLLALDWRETEIPDRDYFERIARGQWRGVLIDYGGARTWRELDAATMRTRGAPPPVLTPFYAPPEVLPGNVNEQGSERSRFTPWIDVYAAGLTIYQLLTGYVPYAHLKDAPDGRDLKRLVTVKREERDGAHRPIARFPVLGLDWSDCQLAGAADDKAREDLAERLFALLSRATHVDSHARGTAKRLREDLGALLGVEAAAPDATIDPRVARPWTSRKVGLDAFSSRLTEAARDGSVQKRESGKLKRRGDDFWEMQGFSRP